MISRFWPRLTVAIVTFAIGLGLYSLVSLSVSIQGLEPVVPPNQETHSSTSDCFPGTSIPVRTSAGRHDLYFPSAPDGLWGNRELLAEYYSLELAKMREPSLNVASEATESETYRFLWIRSSDNPVAVRVEVSDEGPHLFLTEDRTHWLRFRGELKLVSRTRALTTEEWDHFRYLLDRACFWEMPTTETAQGRGHDGAEWVLEGTFDGRYKVVDRWSPADPAYRAVCLYLLQLSKLNLSADEVY
jgi:hypothetical protein